MSEAGITIYVIVFFYISSVLSDNCKISWMETGHEVAESDYALHLSIVNTTGSLRTYFPNTYYDISIESKLRNHMFTQFYFTIWNKNKTQSYGTLELREKELSMFHNGPYCINRIIDGPVSLAKLELKIGWQSPPVNSGCIEFRAAVKETELRYHIANITVCQDPRVQLDDPGEIMKECCACDDGKYEMTFEGLWSRYTHPKHFPKREWLAVFPSVVGASHSPDYQFWRAYTNASEGLKRYAVTGYTTALELELKANRYSIGTLIKFQGANFQNKTRKSYAGVRVTKEQHLVSLVARIEPSPDWFIGVTSLELCQADCTWIESKTLNLYAYDVGVRNGILYEDKDLMTDPPDIIQSLNMTWPPPQNKLEAPFYDAQNNTHDVRPLARIHLKRLRGSEKSCQHRAVVEDCVTSWSKWGECSENCTTGVSKRSRTIKKDYKETNCTLPLEEAKPCQVSKHCPQDVTKEDCALTEWSDWTKCEKICGQEAIKRSRSYKWHVNITKCITKFGKQVLEEKVDCGNPPCPDDIFICVDSRYTSWTDWTECSVTEGSGFRYRYRQIKEHLKRVRIDYLDGDTDYGYSACLYETDSCEVLISNGDVEKTKPEMTPKTIETTTTTNALLEKPEYCDLAPDEGKCPNGEDDNSHKYYYDSDKGKCLPFKYTGCGGNDNRFNDIRACIDTCVVHGRKINCQMSLWSTWSSCKGCNDFRSRRKKVLVEPQNGGRLCPLMKVQREPCKDILPRC